MSSALVRQALEFVDQEENTKKSSGKGKKATSRGPKNPGQVPPDHRHLYKSKNKKPVGNNSKTPDQIAEENVKKLLKLSHSVTDKSVAAKIVARASKGKPLSDYIEVPKHVKEEYILFPPQPAEPYRKFEEEYFCS